MYAILQQKDITVNQHHGPSYELVKDKIVTKEMYDKALFERIDRRIEQIDNLKRLKDEELSDEEFYELVKKVYFITYENKSVLNVNILSDYDLTIRLGVNSTIEFDQNKFYRVEEIYELFKEKEILLSNINICEYDYKYYKKVYGVERKDFVLVPDDKLGKIYSDMNRKLNDSYNKKIIDRVRRIITKERIESDYRKLIDFTNLEFVYLKNVDSEFNAHQLTY